jgi:hypothetical protein
MADQPLYTFSAIFEAALQDYPEQVGVTSVSHPLAVQLQDCDSIDSIMTVLLDQAPSLREFPGRDRLMKSIERIVYIISGLSTALTLGGYGVALVSRKALVTYSTALMFFTAFPTCESNFRSSRYPT